MLGIHANGKRRPAKRSGGLPSTFSKAEDNPSFLFLFLPK
jgi:hypothetical protein